MEKKRRTKWEDVTQRDISQVLGLGRRQADERAERRVSSEGGHGPEVVAYWNGIGQKVLCLIG